MIFTKTEKILGIIAIISLAIAFIGLLVTVVNPPMHLEYAQTVTVNDNQGIVYAQTSDGSVWSWYEDSTNAPIADTYVIALYNNRVIDAKPIYEANLVIVEE